MAQSVSEALLGLRLAQFPSEVLRIITLHLSGYEIVRLLHLTGFKLLWSKFQAYGVECIRLSASVNRRSDILRARSFCGLRELRLEWQSAPKVEVRDIIDLLPETLVKLAIEHDNAETMWLRDWTEDEKNDVRFLPFNHGGMTPVNLGRVLPRLEYLWLKGTTWNGRWSGTRNRWTSGMHCLFLWLLPRGLTYLHMENLDNAFGFPFWEVLPPHLTHLSCRLSGFSLGSDLSAVLPPSLLESLTSLALSNPPLNVGQSGLQLPQHLTSLTVTGGVSPPLPSSLTHLHIANIWNSASLNDVLCAQLLPKALTSLQLEHSSLGSDFVFPPSLRVLRLGTSQQWTRFTNLPASLERLELTSNGATTQPNWTTLPQGLLALHTRASPRSKLRLQGLPPQLRELHIDASDLDLENIQALPKGLTQLRLDGDLPNEFHRQFVISMPPNLTQLHLAWTQLTDVDYAQMPKTLTSLHARCVYFTGSKDALPSRCLMK